MRVLLAALALALALACAGGNSDPGRANVSRTKAGATLWKLNSGYGVPAFTAEGLLLGTNEGLTRWDGDGKRVKLWPAKNFVPIVMEAGPAGEVFGITRRAQLFRHRPGEEGITLVSAEQASAGMFRGGKCLAVSAKRKIAACSDFQNTYLLGWDGGSHAKLPTDIGASAMAFGSDGWFAIGGQRADLGRRHDRSTYYDVQLWATEEAKQAHHVIKLRNESIKDLRFSPDGNKLVIATTKNTYVYPSEGGDPIHTFPGGSMSAKIALTSDGKTLAIVRQAGRITLADLASGDIRKEMRGGSNPTGLAFSPDGKKLVVTGSASVETWGL